MASYPLFSHICKTQKNVLCASFHNVFFKENYAIMPTARGSGFRIKENLEDFSRPKTSHNYFLQRQPSLPLYNFGDCERPLLI